jgi:hypothetical protein
MQCNMQCGVIYNTVWWVLYQNNPTLPAKAGTPHMFI